MPAEYRQLELANFAYRL